VPEAIRTALRLAEGDQIRWSIDDDGTVQRRFTSAMKKQLLPTWEARWATDGRITWQYTASGAIEITNMLIRRAGTHDV
jgi:hypothetical protein